MCTLCDVSQSLFVPNMVLLADNASLFLGDFDFNDQWTITGTNVVTGTREGMSNIKFYLILKRKPFYFVLNIVAPTILLSLMSLAVFWLPTHADEKMGLSVTILLAFTVFMFTVSTALPTSSDNTSLLGAYE
jgi:hypothetical protein